MKGLVIDLRNNPGGVVESALGMAAMFLKPGDKLLSVKGRHARGDEVLVPKDAKPYAFPVAILINEKTASASEIFTGALQDHKRAAVVGEQSYGKGLVQSVFNLSSNSAVALTTAFYYTRPMAGRCSVRWRGSSWVRPIGSKDYGIHPDEPVPPPPVTRLRAVLEASGALTTFATEYTQKNKIAQDFTVTPELLDELKVWLSAHSIQPSIGEWLQEKSWMENRLKQEVVNLSFGVEKGDEVEAQRDPVILRALARL